MKIKTEKPVRDISYNVQYKIKKLLNELTEGHYLFHYWHDKYPVKNGRLKHTHRFKCAHVFPREVLQELCDGLADAGYSGWVPTSEKTETWSGIACYRSVKVI